MVAGRTLVRMHRGDAASQGIVAMLALGFQLGRGLSSSRIAGAGRIAWMSCRGICHCRPSLSTVNVQESKDTMFAQRARDQESDQPGADPQTT
jgi:hypothetical protein